MRTRKATAIRQEQLVDAARRLVAQRGMAKLTTKELAKVIGITEAAIYRHFPSKKAIIRAMIEDVDRKTAARVERIRSLPQPPLQQLETLFYEHLSNVERRRGMAFLVMEEVLRNGDQDLRRRMGAVVVRYLSMVEEILTQGIKEGQIDSSIDVKAAAISMLGKVQVAAILQHLGPTDNPAERRHDALWAMFKRAVAPGAAMASKTGPLTIGSLTMVSQG
jgi:AcrR family transcriptional regulator